MSGTAHRLRVAVRYVEYAHRRWANAASRQLMTYASRHVLIASTVTRREFVYLPVANAEAMRELRRVAREIVATEEHPHAEDPRWPHPEWVRRTARRILERLER